MLPDSPREAGAEQQATALAERLPGAGLFRLFRRGQYRNRADTDTARKQVQHEADHQHRFPRARLTENDQPPGGHLGKHACETPACPS